MADYVSGLCGAGRKGEIHAGVEMEQWKASLENIGTKVSRANTEYIMSEWNVSRK